ncbi:MAG: hypothetical protein ACLQHS_09780 [Candidatus Limnocylindrales bacterium]
MQDERWAPGMLELHRQPVQPPPRDREAPSRAGDPADPAPRIWPSAWAWMPVDRGMGAFRLSGSSRSRVRTMLLAIGTSLVLTA